MRCEPARASWVITQIDFLAVRVQRTIPVDLFRTLWHIIAVILLRPGTRGYISFILIQNSPISLSIIEAKSLGSLR